MKNCWKLKDFASKDNNKKNNKIKYKRRLKLILNKTNLTKIWKIRKIRKIGSTQQKTKMSL